MHSTIKDALPIQTLLLCANAYSQGYVYEVLVRFYEDISIEAQIDNRKTLSLVSSSGVVALDIGCVSQIPLVLFDFFNVIV